MQNSKSARDTIATIQIKTPRKCANTQNTNVINRILRMREKLIMVKGLSGVQLGL